MTFLNEMMNPEGKTELSDVIHLRGCYEIGVYGPNQELVGYRKVDNVVVTAGRSWVLSRIMSQAPSADVINNIAVGTSTTAPATGDTALISQAQRNTISTFVTGGLTNNPPSWQAQCTFATNEANTTLGEAGIFDSSSAGTMLSRVTFATIAKTTSNTLAVSYTISN